MHFGEFSQMLSLDIYIRKYVQLHIEQDWNKTVISHPWLSRKELQAYNSNQKVFQRFLIDQASETLQWEFIQTPILNLLMRKGRGKSVHGT